MEFLSNFLHFEQQKIEDIRERLIILCIKAENLLA